MYVEEFAGLCDQYANDFGSAPLPGAMQECHAAFIEGEKQIFATATSPAGNAWAPRKDTAGHPLLNQNGTLYQAATGGSGSVVRIGDREMEAGVAKGTAGSLAGVFVHQFGAVIRPVTKKFLSWVTPAGVRRFAKQVTIPARPYIGATAETLGNMAAIIQAAVMREVFKR